MQKNDDLPPPNAEMIASLQATVLLFRMFSLDELRQMQANRPQPPNPQEEER